jgi:hypothetical protein
MLLIPMRAIRSAFRDFLSLSADRSSLTKIETLIHWLALVFAGFRSFYVRSRFLLRR